MYMQKPYDVLVKINEDGIVTEINSSAFIEDISGWHKIDEGFGDKFHHAQGNYLTLPLIDDRGILQYKLENGNIVERTKEEMDADYVPIVYDTDEIDELRVRVDDITLLLADMIGGAV